MLQLIKTVNWASICKIFNFCNHIIFCVHRVKKLRETLVAVQQLDKNMNSLRSWLAHIENELSKPIFYDSCDFQEIQRKLDLQQVTVYSTV